MPIRQVHRYGTLGTVTYLPTVLTVALSIEAEKERRGGAGWICESGKYESEHVDIPCRWVGIHAMVTVICVCIISLLAGYTLNVPELQCSNSDT